jgi:hypothetical protein
MKKRTKRILLFLFVFFYLFLLLFLRGKVIEKSKEVYKKEKELLELEYRSQNTKLKFLKLCFLEQEKEDFYAQRK